MKPTKLSDTQVQNTLTSAVKEAVDFIESEVAPARVKAQKYFDGRVNLSHEEGRSNVVATKCRDTVRAVKPALMRVFLQGQKPVEFIPRRPDAVDAAEQATAYAEYVFNLNNGFDIISDVFHDALVKKVGIAKAYYDEQSDVEFDEYSGLMIEQVAAIQQDPEVEVLEIEQGEDGTFEMKVSRESSKGEIKVTSVAPEDYIVDRSATSIADCYVCGHSTEGRVGDLVEMGFDFEEVYELSGTTSGTSDDEEELARTGWDSDDQDEDANDPSMRKVQITEAYMRMDIEGTGIPKRYKFVCAGEDYSILEREVCDDLPFSVFEVDPEPHAFFGRSLVEIITDDQDAATSLLRGLLDSISMSLTPRMAVDKSAVVNMEEVLNNEIGAIIQTKVPPAQVFHEFALGNGSTMALPAMQMYDEAIRAKTGVTGAGMGLDADALQSQTAAGVNAAVQAASAVAELIARTLAEGGFKQLFQSIAKLARQHPDQNTMMRLDGKFVAVDPRSWTSDMDMMANVGLGTGQHGERIMALQAMQQFQMGVWQGYGPQNGMVTMTGIRNAQADLARLMGVYNVDRYLNPMDPQTEQQLLMQQAQQAQQTQQGSDPNQAFLQAEQMKAQVKAQTDAQKMQLDAQKAMGEHQRKIMEMAQADDLARDKMAQDLAVDAANLMGKYGTQLNIAQLKAEQAMPRGPMNG